MFGLLGNLTEEQRYGLMMAAAQAFQPGPGGHAGAAGRALERGLMGYQGAMGLKDRRLEEAQQRELRGIALTNARQGLQDDAAYRGALGQAPNFAAPSAPNMAPTPENASQLKAKTPYEQAMAMAEYLRGKGVADKYIKTYEDRADKLRPKAKADQQLIKQKDGSLGMLNIFDDGSTELVPYAPAEKQRDMDLGGVRQMVGEYSGMPGQSFATTMSPGERARLAQSEAHFQQGFNKPQLVEGQDQYFWATPPTARGGSSVAPAGIDSSKGRPGESELVSAGYANRMSKAEGIFGKIGAAGAPTMTTFAAANMPGVSDPVKRRAIERQAMTDDQRQYRQAQEDWVRAKLRKESGAVIADDEMQREIETYFPQFNDDAKTIAQKAEARKTALAGMTMASGRAGRRSTDRKEDPLGIR